jgi:hypothetical protein
VNPYMFVILCYPLPDNKNYDLVGGAHVHIWVMDNSLEKAQERAFEYIRKYSWEPQEIEHAFEIQPQQIPFLHKDEENLFLMAGQYGIAADFLAWRKQEGQSGDPVLIFEP